MEEAAAGMGSSHCPQGRGSVSFLSLLPVSKDETGIGSSIHHLAFEILKCLRVSACNVFFKTDE